MPETRQWFRLSSPSLVKLIGGGSRKAPTGLCRRFTADEHSVNPLALLRQNDVYTYPDLNVCMYDWGAGCDTGVFPGDCVFSSNSTEGGIAGGSYFGLNSSQAIPTWARETEDVSGQ